MVTEFLPGPAHPPKVSGEQIINSFSCDALTSNGNGLYDPLSNQGKAYTDTDSDGKTEIITDSTLFKGKLIAIEVKVDPGSKTNCIPLSHFRHLFPQLCSKDGNPKESALEPTLAQFEAYDGGILHSHRWSILPTWDIRDSKKFHPVRYYVVTKEDAKILISHATATWLDLWRSYVQTRCPKSKALLPGPQHPPKVKYREFCQNDCTTSHRKIRKLTISTLRAISSVTKTHRTLLKPQPRSFLGPRCTPSFTNLAQSRSAV